MLNYLISLRASEAIYPKTSFGLPEVKKWEKVKAEVKVEVKGVNPAQRANLQERVAITLLLRRANNSWEILFSSSFFLRVNKNSSVYSLEKLNDHF